MEDDADIEADDSTEYDDSEIEDDADMKMAQPTMTTSAAIPIWKMAPE